MANSTKSHGMAVSLLVMPPTFGCLRTHIERARSLAVSRGDALTGYRYADWCRSEHLGFRAPPGQMRPAHPGLETGQTHPAHPDLETGRAGQPFRLRAKSCAEAPRSREC